eukprot:scaffold149961_cov39-Attheya_sp.AAC.2
MECQRKSPTKIHCIHNPLENEATGYDVPESNAVYDRALAHGTHIMKIMIMKINIISSWKEDDYKLQDECKKPNYSR